MKINKIIKKYIEDPEIKSKLFWSVLGGVMTVGVIYISLPFGKPFSIVWILFGLLGVILFVPLHFITINYLKKKFLIVENNNERM